MADEPAVNTPDPAAGQTGTVTLQDDNEAKIATLEGEKAQLTVEMSNWKMAALKAKAKAKEEGTEIDEDERMKDIAREALAESRLAEIAREQDGLLKQALKENKELKLAALNKKEPSAATGAHSEAPLVQDTQVTPEQMAAFKAKGWDDKKIERYKRNLARYATK